jgi:hypothetical protein
LNGTSQLLVYAEYFNLLSDKENIRSVTDVRKQVILEECMLMCRHQTAQQNHNIKKNDRCFEMWQSSNTWKRHYRTEIAFMKELKAESFGGMLVTRHFTIFCFLIRCLKN